MIIRTKEIIEAQNEIDELEKFRDRNIINRSAFKKIPTGYKKNYNYVLLSKTISKKKEELSKLYVKQMEIYLNKEGSKEDA